MRTEADILGWDLGGAHAKAVALDARGRVLGVSQLACPLWQGYEHLDRALAGILAALPRARLHALTMTGEVTDFFADRAAGVRGILARFARQVPARKTLVYAGRDGFLSPARAARRALAVASANWAASAELVALALDEALFVDIGSTTTDLVPLRRARIAARGWTDAERLACGELVYTGVVRTPVLALTPRIAFGTRSIAPMAEFFATSADVYRLTGELPRGADLLPAADNGAKSARASARRLARMIGRDLDSAPLSAWRRCARTLAAAQLQSIEDAARGVTGRARLAAHAPVVGAGVGRFLAKKLACRLGRPYLELDALIAGAGPLAANCAPALAVGRLAQGGQVRRP